MLLLGVIYARLASPLAQKLATTHAFPVERILRGTPEAHLTLSRRGREMERDEQQSMKE